MVHVNKGEELKSELEVILSKVAKFEKLEDCDFSLDLNSNIGDGFMGQIYAAEIFDKKSHRKLEVVIKAAPTSDFVFDVIYKNEVVFYTLIYPTLVRLYKETSQPFNNVPKFYTWSIDSNKSYLVMENLKRQGYTLYPKEKFFDEKHLNLIFTTYGKFHALSYVWRKRDPKTFKKIHHEEYKDLSEMRMDSSKNILQNCLQAAINYLDPNSPVYLELETLPKNILPTMLKAIRYTGQYSCSLHGDCWSNNLMFKYEESGEVQDVKMIDFQLGRESTPVHDLSYFFYSGACKADLDKLEDYLRVYHTAFAETVNKCGENPEDIFPYEVLVEEWRQHALFGLILGVHLWEIKLTPKSDFVEDLEAVHGGEKSDQTDIEKMVKLIEKLGKVVKSQDFKERAVPLLIHGYEFGILRKEKIIESTNKTTSSN